MWNTYRHIAESPSVKRIVCTQPDDILEMLSDDELENVDGGAGRVVGLGDGLYECTFSCDACCGYSETLGVLHTDLKAVVQGVFTCPKCSYTRNYEIHYNVGNEGYYIRNWK